MRLFRNRGGSGLVANWRVFEAAWRWLPERAASLIGRYYPDTKIRGRAELLRLLPEGSTGVEVGVWRGDFARVILHAVEPSRLHLVDPWRFDPERPEAWHGGAQAASQEEMDAIYCEVVDRFRGDERVSVHRATSAEVAGSVSDAELDWIYLDGDHSYEGVRADLRNWLPKLRCGGLLCGDDYGVAGWWGDGVTRAVNEALRNAALRPLLLHGGQYAIRKHASARDPTRAGEGGTHVR